MDYLILRYKQQYTNLKQFTIRIIPLCKTSKSVVCFFRRPIFLRTNSVLFFHTKKIKEPALHSVGSLKSTIYKNIYFST